MTAEFANDRRRRRAVILVGLVLAVVAAAGAYYLLTRTTSAPPTVQTQTVVVAAQLIPARTLIQDAMLTTKSVPVSPVWANTAIDKSAVVGKIALVDIPA